MKSIKHYIKATIGNPRKAIWQIDTLLFGGKFKSMLRQHKEAKQLKLEHYIAEHPEEYYDQQRNAILQKGRILDTKKFAVRDLLFSQFADGEAVYYDVAVRLLAIEEYYGKNTIGYDLFSRLQNNIVKGDFWIPRFEKLIQSFEANGYNKAMQIEVDENIQIIDGAGRLALAIYHNEEFVPVRFHKSTIKREYNYNHLWELNYSREEIKLIHEKAIELLNKFKYSFVGVIWPSAYHLREEITKEINSHLKEGQCLPLQYADCNVVKYVDMAYDEIDFRGFMRAMYFADNMTETVLQWKTQVMIECAPKDIEGYPVRLLYIDVLNPKMILNDGNYSARSLQIANLKKVIRNRYKPRLERYEYDNILHVSDNYKQSRFCEIVENMNRDITDMFKLLNKQYEYAAIKLEGRQSADFPHSVYLNTDVDVLVARENVRKIGETIQAWLKEKYDNTYDGWVKVSRIADKDEQIMIVVWVLGFSCFMMHIQTVSHFGLRNEFGRECLSHRVLTENKLVYSLPAKYEMIFRASEILHAPKKVWHREYAAKYISEYEESLVDIACGHQPELLQGMKDLFGQLTNEKR